MIPAWLMAVVVITAFVSFIALSAIAAVERQNLYDRLMSRDLGEYLSIGESPPKRPMTAHEKAMKKWHNTADKDSKGGDDS